MLIPPNDLPALPLRPIIIHNDLDGLLSYLFLREKGYELAGIYDLDTLYMAPGFKPSECLAVDLDITHPLIPSVGHHFTLFSGEHHINMNTLFGVSAPENVSERLQQAFHAKCPIPTALFLHWMTGTPLPLHPLRRAWLVYADTLHQSHAKYRPNVSNWLRALGYDDLLDDLNENRLSHHFPHILDLLSKHGCKPTTKKPFPQCKFPPAKLATLLPLLQGIARNLGYNSPASLPLLKPYLTGTRYSLGNNPAVREALERKFQNWDLFSHGLIFLDQIEVTLLTPLSPQADSVLLAGLKSRYGSYSSQSA